MGHLYLFNLPLTAFTNASSVERVFEIVFYVGLGLEVFVLIIALRLIKKQLLALLQIDNLVSVLLLTSCS